MLNFFRRMLTLQRRRGHIDEPPGATEYPTLLNFFSAYFHQDFDIFGNTLTEIVAEYRRSDSESDVARARRELIDFLDKSGPDDVVLANRFEEVFRPGVIVEGWEGLTTREWLVRLADLLGVKPP